MSLYFQRLSKLRSEIAEEKKRRKRYKKKFTSNQLIMIDFINNVTKEATFYIKGRKIILKKGNEKKGFKHILIKHYCKGCNGELTMSDILNFDLYLQRAIKLNEEGVTNPHFDVYYYLKGTKRYKIVLNSINEYELVVTYYSLG